MLYSYMSSAPHTFGRPSSPLNPNPQTSSSSPPQQARSSSFFSPGSGGGQFQLSSPTPAPMSTRKTRYKRPESMTVSSKKYTESAPAELFAEGTTPTEGLMWRERFSRRMEDREKRRKSREAEIDRRRVVVEEEEDEAKAREDDEEIFRRLMVRQRKREERAAQISYELENGGSDPVSPDFWDEEEEQEDVPDWAWQQGRDIINTEMKGNQAGPSNYQQQYQTPQRPRAARGEMVEDEEDQWAVEAAKAEEEEREAEEAELARQIEESYAQANAQVNINANAHAPNHNIDATFHSDMAIDDIEMDWDVDMDI